MSADKGAVLDALRGEIARIERSGSPSSGFDGRQSRRGGSSSASPIKNDEAFQWVTFAADSDESRAFNKIKALACRREYSQSSLRKRLARGDYSDEAIECAIERAVRCGLISDARFAEVLVRSRISQGKGLSGIARELTDEGIDPFSVPQYVDAANGSIPSEVDRAIEVISRRPPHSKHPRESAYRKLVSKGYSSSVASSASRIWFESLSAD